MSYQGCTGILEEHASGADRGRPVLARLLRDIRNGETLLVVRLAPLARSVSHLLSVIEQLDASGTHFRSLHCKASLAFPGSRRMKQAPFVLRQAADK